MTKQKITVEEQDYRQRKEIADKLSAIAVDCQTDYPAIGNGRK